MKGYTNRTAAINRRAQVRRAEEAHLQKKGGPGTASSSLTIGDPNSHEEKEADAIAGSVVNGGTAAGVALGAAPKKIQAKAEERETLMAKGDDGGLQGTEHLQNSLDSSKGGGEALKEETRNEMEHKMGADLSDVKIHTGDKAHKMAEGINAKAFTHGQDVYFKNGNYDPESRQGKELLAHELAHTRQQKSGISPKLQTKLEPADVASEMIGKKFTLDKAVDQKYPKDGTVSFPAGQQVTAKTWDNNSREIQALVYHGEKKKNFTITVSKTLLTPVVDKKPGLDQYHSGADATKKGIARGDQKMIDLAATKGDHEKYHTMDIYNAELKRLTAEQEARYKDLNEKTIQETMFNNFDASIKKWTDFYNKKFSPKEKLNANSVKSLLYEETKMGTRGEHLEKPPYSWNDPKKHPLRSRYNLGQAIDSWGQQQYIMIKEMAPAIYTKYGLASLEKQNIWKGMTNEEYAANSNFMAAIQEFNSYKDNKQNNLMGDDKNDLYNDYDFWIRTSIQWLYEKYNSLDSPTWSGAVKAYNGDKNQAANYRDRVMKRVKNKSN